jgi:hypothetical protein
MKVIVEMLTAPTMLGKARHAWMAVAIMANASEVAASRITEEAAEACVHDILSPERSEVSFHRLRTCSARSAISS